MMTMVDGPPSAAEFAVFVRAVEPGLRQALVATYGAIDGREATVDALSWAWEHWDRIDALRIRPAMCIGSDSPRRVASQHVIYRCLLMRHPIVSCLTSS